ncbi:MAG: type II secretion system protein [Chloroflexi bacterium]|nr:type II secretion system protein [Chloroflexota bacterium]
MTTHESVARGFTLVEVVIALTIAGLLVTALAGTLSLTLSQVPKEGAKLAVENRQQLARYWLARDANSAETYTLGTSPQYGAFTWTDYSGQTPVTYDAVYYYDAALSALMRQVRQNGVVQETFQVAGDIVQESAVAFAWSEAEQKIAVTVTPTIEEAPGLGDIGRTATVVAFLRYKGQYIVSPPGMEAVPTPPPGSFGYCPAADPTIVRGTYVSGSVSSLCQADSEFLVVDSVNAGGPFKVVWEGSSQTITSPASIGQLQVRFTGKMSKNNVRMDFYVKGPSGYEDAPDSSFTFPDANVATTHSFYLNAAKVAYVDTTRVAELKVERRTDSNFTIYTDQVLFIASP